MKKIKTFLTVLGIFAFTAGASAQLEKTIHQTFEIGDATKVVLSLTGETEIEPWAGNSLMTKSVVQLFDASPSILDHFVEKEKRYQINIELTENVATLHSLDQQRKPIHTRQGLCAEKVLIKIFIPDSFTATDSTNTIFIRNN